MKPREKGADVRGALRSILGEKAGDAAFGGRATQQDIADALTKAAIAVEDAHMERDHWKAAHALVTTEMVMLASVLINRHKRKLVIRSSDFTAVASDMQLHVANPEPGIRVYELRKMEGKKDAKVVLNG